MTNIEKIQNMTPEELTMFLNLWADVEYCRKQGYKPKNPYSYSEVKIWLESEVE